MDSTVVLAEARSALEAAAGRTTNLIRSLSDLSAPIPGSRWTVREAAVHLVNCAGLHRDIAEGTPSPVESLAPEVVAAANAGRLADIPEDDPGKLAGLLGEAVAGFLETTAYRPGHQPVVFHGGLPLDLAALACTTLGEQVLHGYDIAVGAAAPWPIDRHAAELALYGYRRLLGGLLDVEAAAAMTATYAIDLGSGTRFTAELADGRYGGEAAPSQLIDCTISADPVTFLLVASRRLSQWAAFALGALIAGGPRPELAPRFMDLFAYP
jgi:hypothetical protein